MKRSRLNEIIKEEVQNFLLNENVGGAFFKKYGKKAVKLTLKNRDKFLDALKNTPNLDVSDWTMDNWKNYGNPRTRKPKEVGVLADWYVEFAGNKIKSLFSQAKRNKDYGDVYLFNGKKGNVYRYSFSDDELVEIDPKVVPEKLFLIYQSDMEGNSMGTPLFAVYARTRNESLEKIGKKGSWYTALESNKSDLNSTIKDLENDIKAKQEALKNLKKPIK